MAVDLRKVLEVLADGVIVVDAGLHVLDANSEACRLLDCSAEWIAGQLVWSVRFHAAAKIRSQQAAPLFCRVSYRSWAGRE